jgi:hypothetical protein
MSFRKNWDADRIIGELPAPHKSVMLATTGGVPGVANKIFIV